MGYKGTSKYKFKVGDRFGKLVVLDTTLVKQKILCRCACGKEKWFSIYLLLIGRSKSCGCGKKDSRGSKYSFNIGDTFGFLSVIDPAIIKNCVRCKCICGKEIVRDIHSLMADGKHSCGCRRYTIKHGMHDTPIYAVWCAMLKRCRNENDPNYPNYGARGIRVCEEWNQFENFYKDMGDIPEGKSIDRIDNNFGYFPENCRWATNFEQADNKRTTLRVNYNGKNLTLREWSEETGIAYTVLSHRYQRKWSTECMLTTPTHIKNTTGHRNA